MHSTVDEVGVIYPDESFVNSLAKDDIEEDGFTWENINKVNEIKEYLKL